MKISTGKPLSRRKVIRGMGATMALAASIAAVGRTPQTVDPAPPVNSVTS